MVAATAIGGEVRARPSRASDASSTRALGSCSIPSGLNGRLGTMGRAPSGSGRGMRVRSGRASGGLHGCGVGPWALWPTGSSVGRTLFRSRRCFSIFLQKENSNREKIKKYYVGILYTKMFRKIPRIR